MPILDTIRINGVTYDIGGSGEGMSDGIKSALDQIAQKVAYIDEDGQDYYTALHSALYPPANLSYITCVYTQSGTVYDTDTLDSLKSDLVVTAHYSNGNTQTVTSYTLSGTLTEGTSSITVAYGGKTTNFTVTVTHVIPDTSPTVEYDNSVLSTSGGVNSDDPTYEGLCVTPYYNLTQQQQTDSQFVIMVYCPTTPSYTNLRTVLYNGDTKVTYWNLNYLNEPQTKTLSANTTRIRCTLMKTGLSKSYLYCVDTGQILFAGSETPYYGKSNISEVNV